MLDARRLKRILFGLVLACFAAVPLVVAFWTSVSKFITEYEPAFRLVGYIVGPFLAVLGFIWTRIDKHEIRRQAAALREQEVRAEHLRQDSERAASEVRRQQTIVEQRENRIAELEADLVRLTTQSNELWKVRPPKPFPEYAPWLLDPEGAIVVTTAIYKGGVGKTHISANFAAYVSEKQGKPVLLIDLDHQGSLSSIVLRSIESETVGSHVDALFEQSADLATLSAAAIHLTPEILRGWIVPADYSLHEVESRLLLKWLINAVDQTDVRYRLAKVLLNPAVRRQYGAIIIDTPPRLSMAPLNAFIASHFYLVPTILDRVSGEAVEPFLRNIQAMKADLGLHIKCAGIVSCMTRQVALSPNEVRAQNQIREVAKGIIGGDRDPFIRQHIPRKAVIANDETGRLPYHLTADGTRLRDIYDAVFDEVWSRITNPAS